MKAIKPYLIIFVLQILIGVNAGLSFSLLPSRYMAALVAGTGFLLLGIYIAAVMFRLRKWKSALFWMAVIHLVIFSIPLLGSRLLDPSTAFEEMTFWGMPGPEFHKLSERFYGLFIVVTLIEGALVGWAARKSAPIRTIQ